MHPLKLARFTVGTLALITFSSEAQEMERVETFKQSDSSVVWLKGTSPEPAVLSLAVVPGKVADKAIRVFSEPSHTLLALVVDREFAESGAGQVWQAREVRAGSARATATTKLPEAMVKLALEAPPAEDSRIAVHVYADWPGKKTEDRIVADALLADLSEFEFSVSLGSRGGPDGLTWDHCCSGGGCTESVCKSCSGYAFSCCVIGSCCSIECGWEETCTCAECDCA